MVYCYALCAMNAENTLQLFEDAYGGGEEVIQLPPEDPTEIICVIHPTDEHPEWSRAVAAIEKSVPHVHRITTETYRMIRGVLHLHCDDEVHRLVEGDVYVVHPGQVHWGETKEDDDLAIVDVECRPGWTAEDHILV
ncbi:hypothetical protein COU77_00650 [Candidatus Peregrinibacteria bacterium CG10_big_fil_rev_8_21_14_0_10_49_16]|nr:MAG: hypothetical protein COW95_04595 [Candidatus Peregrinibacteria bacterium CG22_combo_CG10-13_8_21_14_all_49_11]PIR52373.1 MAG: hypothetical protein COU77_00650 [Candidatus Peregrinibacteria bacterium CG10_big_fil_rev_8_21_14_0_10_49_16]